MVKLLAAAFMLLDHVGLLLLPEATWLRWVGRLSMPMFAYAMAKGYARAKEHGTVCKYAVRLSVLALACQPVWWSVFGWWNLNMCFTWTMALGLLACWDGYPRWRSVAVISAVMALDVLGFFPVDYGSYGVVLPLVFHESLVRRETWWPPVVAIVCLSGLWTVGLGGFGSRNWVGAFAVPVIAALRRAGLEDRPRVDKWFFYVFYPAHFLVLCAIQELMAG